MPSSSESSPIDAISTPESEVQIPFVAHEKANFEGYGGKYTIHHFYLRCHDVQKTPIRFPLDANPRHPEMNAQVGAMRDTLQNDPKDFVNRNNGIVVLASEVDSNEEMAKSDHDGMATFTFEKGEGVCNGGHTLLAIQNYGEETEAVVHVEVIELEDFDADTTSRRQEISKIADARNNNNQLQERSEANFIGYYDQYKRELIDEHVIHWHEGDPQAVDGAIDAYQFFRQLKSLDVDAYGHPLYDERGKNHSQLATSVTRVHRTWKDEMDDWKSQDGDPESRPLRYLTPLANDIIYIRDMVSHHLQHFDYGPGMRQKNLFQKYIKQDPRPLLIDMFEHKDGYDIPNPVEVLFTGLFRTNLYLSESDTKSTQLVGWFIDLNDIWAQRSKAVLNELQGDFADNENDPKDFIRANAPFTHDFYLHGMTDRVDQPPEIVYKVDEEDRARYHRVKESSDATHELTVNSDPDKPDQLVERGGNIDEIPMKRIDLEEVFNYATMEG